MKLWQKNLDLDAFVEQFTAGSDPVWDQKLVPYDCLGTIAHVRLLAGMNVITADQALALERELLHIKTLAEQNEFPISPADEDCHTAIENHLTRTLGETGKTVHTFRSRNDQVLTALRLYYKDELKSLKGQMEQFMAALAQFKARYGQQQMPGFTHTRKAMPSTVGLWSGAFAESMADNLTFLESVMSLIDQSPLGSGAGYGLPVPLDREFTAGLMGFARVQHNPIYVQNSRGKFEAILLNLLATTLFDLNKLATDLIWFSMPELGYFILPPEFLTGSSIMPHKQNPDFLEILRAYYPAVVSLEFRVKSTVGNLISGYHRDFQMTKEPVFRAFEMTRQGLQIAVLLWPRLAVNEQACLAGMTPELYSAERAFGLVRQGLPFRDAYRQVAETLNPAGPEVFEEDKNNVGPV